MRGRSTPTLNVFSERYVFIWTSCCWLSVAPQPAYLSTRRAQDASAGFASWVTPSVLVVSGREEGNDCHLISSQSFSLSYFSHRIFLHTQRCATIDPTSSSVPEVWRRLRDSSKHVYIETNKNNPLSRKEAFA